MVWSYLIAPLISFMSRILYLVCIHNQLYQLHFFLHLKSDLMSFLWLQKLFPVIEFLSYNPNILLPFSFKIFFFSKLPIDPCPFLLPFLFKPQLLPVPHDYYLVIFSLRSSSCVSCNSIWTYPFLRPPHFQLGLVFESLWFFSYIQIYC